MVTSAGRAQSRTAKQRQQQTRPPTVAEQIQRPWRRRPVRPVRRSERTMPLPQRGHSSRRASRTEDRVCRSWAGFLGPLGQFSAPFFREPELLVRWPVTLFPAPDRPVAGLPRRVQVEEGRPGPTA